MINEKRIPKLQKLLSHYDNFVNLIGCRANCTHDVLTSQLMSDHMKADLSHENRQQPEDNRYLP